MLTGAGLASGNRVEVTLNGDGTFPRLWNDLRSAQESITLQLYYGAPGRMADSLDEILVDRARAGVRVFVLYDAFGTVVMPARIVTRCGRQASWSSRFVRSACPRSTWRRIARTFAGSSSTVVSGGLAVSASMTNGLAMAALAGRGGRRTCASKGRR